MRCAPGFQTHAEYRVASGELIENRQRQADNLARGEHMSFVPVCSELAVTEAGPHSRGSAQAIRLVTTGRREIGGCEQTGSSAKESYSRDKLTVLRRECGESVQDAAGSPVL